MIDVDIIKNPTYCLGLRLDKTYSLDGELISVDFFYKDMNHYDLAIKEKAEQFSKQIEEDVQRTLIAYRKSFDKFLAKRGLENHMGYLTRKDFKYKEVK